jgi:chemotaxis signal transduction protein
LINLRGTLLTVVNLGERFGEAGAMIRLVIVAEGAGRVFGLGVDGVRDVDTVTGEDLEEVDAQRSAGGIVLGLARVGPARNELALVCDVDAVARQALIL